MNAMTKLSGIALASAAATLFLASCGGNSSTNVTMEKKAAAPEAAKVAEVKCAGINACKGKGACASASNACAGQNSCKGQGWIKASKADCDAKGGTVVTG